MNKTIKLNNESFVVKKAKGDLHPITQVRDLGACYAKPSPAKCRIYNYWLRWYMFDSEQYILKHFTINSYNANMFTLLIDVYDITNKFIGQFYITKSRQEFWTV